MVCQQSSGSTQSVSRRLEQSVTDALSIFAVSVALFSP
jgi:hypothetical protein